MFSSHCDVSGVHVLFQFLVLPFFFLFRVCTLFSLVSIDILVSILLYVYWQHWLSQCTLQKIKLKIGSTILDIKKKNSKKKKIVDSCCLVV